MVQAPTNPKRSPAPDRRRQLSAEPVSRFPERETKTWRHNGDRGDDVTRGFLTVEVETKLKVTASLKAEMSFVATNSNFQVLFRPSWIEKEMSNIRAESTSKHDLLNGFI